MRIITIDNQKTIEKVKNYPVGYNMCTDPEDREKMFEMYSGEMATEMIDTLSAMYKIVKAELRKLFYA
jgi:uncharacterized protein YlaI